MRVVKELMLEECIEPSCLCRGARKTVEDEAALAVRLAEPGRDHVTNQVIGHQLAPCHNGLGLHA